LTSVARIPTHLYHFLEFAKQFRGWGRAFKRTVANWMLSKDAENLAFIFTKYAQRDGYSAKDVLRLAKPKPITEDQDMVFKYIAKGILENNNESKAYQYLNAVETLKTLEKSKDIVALTEKFKIPMEIVPTDKRDKQVYSSVVKSAGMTWILRNLANLSRHDVINSNAVGREIVKLIQSKFTDEEQLRKARIHPIAILNALETYKKGNSRDNRWTVNSNILNVLNKAFYKSFEFVEPMNKRVYFGLDCSRSMYGTWSLKPDDILQPATIGACFALAFLKKESDVVFKGFNDTMQPINVHSECSLEEVIRTTQKVNWGSTNCALPMLDAMENNIPVDLFVILTDNDVNTGRIHPFEALKQYRKKMNINAKLVVMATSATLFTIADPSDAGMLDIVGFSPDVFTVIKNFVEL